MKKSFVNVFIIMVLIIGSISLSGCTNKDKDESNYVESMILLPSEISYANDFQIMPDGSICVLGMIQNEKEIALFRSEDKGLTWTRKEVYVKKLPFQKEKYEKVEGEGYLSHTGEIGICLTGYISKEKQIAETFNYLIDANGKVTNPTPNFEKVSSLERDTIFSFHFADNGDLFVSNGMNNLFQLNRENEELSFTFRHLGSQCAYTVSGDSVFGISDKNAEILNPSSKDSEKKLKQLSKVNSGEFYSALGVLELADENEYYFADKSGLWRTGEQHAELLISGENCQLGDELFIQDMEIENRDSIMILANTEQGTAILHYTKTENAPKVETELNAFILTNSENDDSIERLIKDYQRKHPTVKINLKVGVNDYYTPISDVVKWLNTKLLGGDGPDILFLDGLNAAEYVKKGLLLDITKEIAIDSNQLIPRIANTFAENERLFAVPAGFTFMISSGEEDGAAIEHTFDNSSAILYRAIFDSRLYKNNSVRLSDIKEFYQKLDVLKKSYAKNDAVYASFQALNLQVNPLDSFSLIGSENGGQWAIDYIASAKSLQHLYNMKNKENLHFNIFNTDGSGLFIPGKIMAVSKNTAHENAARDFVRYVFSEEGQIILGRNELLPVNIDAFANILANLGEEITISSGVYSEVSSLSETDQKDILNAVKNLSVPVGIDDEMMEIVMNYAMQFINGSKTLDEASADAFKKIKLYQSE